MHVLMADDAQTLALRSAARRHGARVVDRRSDAQIFVMGDVGNPGQKARWAAALYGATLVSAQLMLSAGQEGPYISFKAAVTTRRLIWMSEGFKRRHPIVSGIIIEAAASPRSCWQLIATREAFLAKVLLTKSSPRLVMGIVSAREKQATGSFQTH